MPQQQTAAVTRELGDVAGRVAALLYLTTANGDILFAGTASGGVDRATNAKDKNFDNPDWRPVTDTILGADGKTPVPREQLLGANNIGALAADPRPNSTIIYAGTGEGNFGGGSQPGGDILRSTDGGITWSLWARVAPGLSIEKLIVDRTGKTVYAAVTADTNLFGFRGPGLGNSGVYKITNDGKTVTQLTVDGTKTKTVTDLEYTIEMVAGKSVFVLYAAVGNPYPGGGLQEGNGIFRSADNGATWTPINAGLPDPRTWGRVKLAASRDANPILYAVIASWDGKGLLEKGFFKLQTGEQVWSSPVSPKSPADVRKVVGDQGNYNLALAVDPNDPKRIVLGGQGSFKSDAGGGVLLSIDGGVTWRAIDTDKTPRAKDRPLPHADHHAFTFGGNGDIFDANDGGIWKWVKGASNPALDQNKWVNLNATFSTIQANSVAINNAAPGQILLLEGSQDNGFAQITAAANPLTTLIQGVPWKSMGGGDGGMVRFDPKNSGRGYGITNGKEIGGDYRPLITLFTPNGAILGGVPLPQLVKEDSFPFLPIFALTPKAGANDPTFMALGTTKQVYEGIVDPAARTNWVPILPSQGDAASSSAITSLAYADRNTLFVGTQTGDLLRGTRDANGKWSFVRFGPEAKGGGSFSGPITSIVTTKAIPEAGKVKGLSAQVYVSVATRGTRDNPIFVSNQAAPKWVPVSGNLPRLPVYSLAVDTSCGAPVLYAGNALGLYVSQDAGATWKVIDDEFPIVRVTDLQLYQPPGANAPTALIAATYGRGVYFCCVPCLE
jgi:photosystem II stability/assembly factor-like uncharacterized protein